MIFIGKERFEVRKPYHTPNREVEYDWPHGGQCRPKHKTWREKKKKKGEALIYSPPSSKC
jgi:hypothetical protein